MPFHKNPASAARARRRRRERRKSAQPASGDNADLASRVKEPAAPETFLGRLGEMDEAYEQRAIQGKNQPGHLLQVAPGRAGRGSRVSVHGIDGSPNDVDALTRLGVDEGARASSFAYDDERRRLGDVSDDLAAALRAEMAANPNGPLTIDAHSMGTRIALDALDKLVKSGDIGDREVNLNLVAPLLAGITGGGQEVGTNLSRLAPPGLGALLDGVRPGKDMGSGSPFQERLEQIELPDNVRTRLFTGTEDDMVDTEHPVFRAMSKQLNAEHISIDGADHMSVVKHAAQHMRRE